MPHSRYNKKLTAKEIIKLFDNGFYTVDLFLGLLYSGKTEEELFTYEGNDEGHLFVRLYKAPKMITTAVSRIIWIIGNRLAIPKDFEIHHKDLDVKNNCFNNLYALSKIDHKKLHNNNLILKQDEEIPF